MITAAEAWGGAQHEARAIAAALRPGDYWFRWDTTAEDEEPGEMLAAELGKALRHQGLTLQSDAEGMRVVALEPEATVFDEDEEN